MSKISQIFTNSEELSPSSELERGILRRIELLEAKKMKTELAWSYAGFAGSILAVFYSIFAFGGTLWQSEFWSIISLIFSDAKVVLAYWQDFSFSALETFPFMSVIAFLVPTFTLIMFLNIVLNLIHNKSRQHFIYN